MSEESSTRRPPIPADIRRKVLVEAGHRCAISTCRHIDVDVHHINSWKESQKHEYENLIALCPNFHRRADRGDIDRKNLRIYKRNLHTMHDKFSQLEIDVLFEANSCEPGKSIQWPPFMRLLIKRIYDAGLVQLSQHGGSVSAGGMPISPEELVITNKGREFIEEIGAKEM